MFLKARASRNGEMKPITKGSIVKELNKGQANIYRKIILNTMEFSRIIK